MWLCGSSTSKYYLAVFAPVLHPANTFIPKPKEYERK
jgi:uncharacterized protein YfaQ (DUF2300 family)